MPTYARLVIEHHTIDASTIKQATEILHAHLRARRANLGPGHARVLVIDTDGAHDGLDDLLAGLYTSDEIDPGDHRNPYPGWVPAEQTDLRERLLAWREHAIARALAGAPGHDSPHEGDAPGTQVTP